ncbi:MAG: DNA polymerase I, partial [Quisquiliibacterium sp.]
PMARRLVTIRTDCQLSPQVDSIDASLVLNQEDKDRLRELFQRCGFRSMLRELDGPAQPPAGQDRAMDRAVRRPATARGTQVGVGLEALQAPAVGEIEHQIILTDEALGHWIERIEAAE